MNTDAEILRLRDKIHDQTAELRALTWSFKETEKWKAKIEESITELAETVGELIKSDEIAEAVAAKIEARHTIRLTTMQKAIVSGAGIAAMADFILRLAGG